MHLVAVRLNKRAATKSNYGNKIALKYKYTLTLALAESFVATLGARTCFQLMYALLIAAYHF